MDWNERCCGVETVAPYASKPYGSLGTDFTDAVVERDDRLAFRGDTEIQVWESYSYAQGGYADRGYNGVMLHVVGAESNGRPALLEISRVLPRCVDRCFGVASGRDSLDFPASRITERRDQPVNLSKTNCVANIRLARHPNQPITRYDYRHGS